MRFPLALGANLFKQKIRRFISRDSRPLIFPFSPLITHLPQGFFPEAAPDWEWHSPEACVRAAQRAAAGVVWLGGAEPLLHPEIGRVTRTLTDTGRHVFFHTSGFGLRKRIHEFRPDSRLFVTLELAGRKEAHDRRAGRDGAFREAIEAMRAGKLSGFCVCVHVTMDEQTDAADIVGLFDFLWPRGVDGLVVSCGNLPHCGRDFAVLDEKLAQTRSTIPSEGWRRFSRALEMSLIESRAARAEHEVAGREGDACEESA